MWLMWLQEVTEEDATKHVFLYFHTKGMQSSLYVSAAAASFEKAYVSAPFTCKAMIGHISIQAWSITAAMS